MSLLDYLWVDPFTVVCFVLGCVFAWFLAPALDLAGASVRVDRLRDLRLGSWLAFALAAFGVVASNPWFLYQHFAESPDFLLPVTLLPISALIPSVLVVAGAGVRPSRRVALILIGLFWAFAAAWMVPPTLETNAMWYRYGLIPHSIIDAFVESSPAVSEVLISVCAGAGIRSVSRGMGRGSAQGPVLPVPPEA